MYMYVQEHSDHVALNVTMYSTVSAIWASTVSSTGSSGYHQAIACMHVHVYMYIQLCTC